MLSKASSLHQLPLKPASTYENSTISGIHFVEVSENLRITEREARQKLQKTSDNKFTFNQWKSQDEKLKDMEQ